MTAPDVAAIDALRSALGTGLAATGGGFASFPSLRITGPGGEILVAASKPKTDDDEAAYLAQSRDQAEECERLGTVSQVHAVAGVLRQRLGVEA